MARRKPKVYALYRGDEFVDVGTARELAARRGVSPKYIAGLAGESVRRRYRGENKLLAYVIDGGR